ncbi:ParE-like toxin of type II ParDE toxin-antitoxin system [Chthoniobacter flavus]|nr:type II toxin-antitoxin system RelE/ParE family toxin [Chthoniobacter flavus]TCO89290.1 ParE-like toxin of type II ParDE toxin-antitoxin system [Chthoniobacter flavus]
MSFRVLLRPAAEVDIAQAAAWYDEQQPGLGGEFLEEIARIIEGLPANPFLTARRHRTRNIRWLFPARFPYRVVYEITNDVILIISVIHAARDDRQWRRR